MTGAFNAKKLVIWHDIVPTYGAMIAIIMDMLPWTAQIKYCHLVHWHTSGLTPATGPTDLPPDTVVTLVTLDITATPNTHAMTTGTDLDLVTLNPNPVTTAIGVVATRTLTEVAPDHSTDLPLTTSHVTGAPVPTATIMIHLTKDLHLIGILPGMTADLDIGPGNNITNQDRGSSSTSWTPSWKPKDRRHKQVTIDDPPLEYYSSDDTDSDSDDDLN